MCIGVRVRMVVGNVHWVCVCVHARGHVYAHVCARMCVRAYMHACAWICEWRVGRWRWCICFGSKKLYQENMEMLAVLGDQEIFSKMITLLWTSFKISHSAIYMTYILAHK